MGDSIKLEFLGKAHISEMARLAADTQISATSGVPPNCNEGEVSRWANENLREDRSEVHFAIRLESRMVGCCILKKMDFANRSAELSYWVGVDFWGRGIATSAASVMRDMAFECYNLTYLHSHYLKINNAASGRILSKLGFEPDESKSDVPVADRFLCLAPDAWTFVKLHRSKWLDVRNPSGWYVQSSGRRMP